jgi:hypothetical protein
MSGFLKRFLEPIEEVIRLICKDYLGHRSLNISGRYNPEL